jgi:hypothetical protein
LRSATRNRLRAAKIDAAMEPTTLSASDGVGQSSLEPGAILYKADVDPPGAGSSS